MNATKVLVKYCTNNTGREERFECATVEAAILEYRKRKRAKHTRGANSGKYSINGGNTWNPL
jgi:hypothetical protein